MMVASNLVEPSSIQVSWDDIGSDFVFKIFFQSSQISSDEKNWHKNNYTDKKLNKCKFITQIQK